MLQFLQTGKMLYVLGTICVLGIISKLVTSSLYKRLIKETGNMALTKNKNLKALKQKTENLFLVSHGIRNPAAYIEKQLYGFQFWRVSLDHWDNLSLQAMILCFLAGGAAAFASYWYRCDSYYIVLYGSMGVLAGLVLVLVDNGANIALKRQQLADCLVDYVENSPHFYKNVETTAEYDKRGKAAAGLLRSRGREADRQAARAVGETAAGENREEVSQEEGSGDRTGRFHIEQPEEKEPEERMEKSRTERPGAKLSVLSRKKDSGKELQRSRGQEMKDAEGGGRQELAAVSEEAEGDELARSIEHLRQSLEQIAAGREQSRRENQPKVLEKTLAGRVKKELNQEDLKLLGELLQEYLS